MIIQFSDLLSGKERRNQIDLSYNSKSLKYDGEEIKFLEPIIAKGTVSAKEEIIILETNIKTKLELSCARCLDTFIYPIDIDIEERFTNNKELQEIEEVIFVDSDTIDITEIVENSIISTLPIKRLCKDDCKGLCSQCGKNLNVENCSCNNYDGDIRMAKLQELFSNKEV